MNDRRDPNSSPDLSTTPADPLRADPLASTEHVPGPASTESSHPSAPPPDSLPAVPGYHVLREIARGGMGRVLAAHDLTLERDVALKVLLPGAAADRFVRESKITARLPHPGIPPVYALGTLADGSPFLAMKLIAGQTLAHELQTADRPRLLQAFAQVCQAVGFAHSRGVVHRDLKPANVMVGAFGEVQVMDWGLAKYLTGREVEGEPRSPEALTGPGAGVDPNRTTDYRDPEASINEQTQAGTVLGTPAYMAPEQARGEAADARADVFALGGILCAVLTGQPPFCGKDLPEVLRRARAGELPEAHARLDGCGADGELVALCRRCLNPAAAARPANGQAVADELTAYLDGVQQRLRQAELAEAEARARAAGEAKRRRLTLALAATVLLAVTLGGGSWLWVRSDRAAHAAQVARDANAALNRATGLREQAKAAGGGGAALFAQAREQAQRASALVENSPAEEQLRAQVRSLLAELNEEEKDQQLVAALDAAQLAQAVTVAGESRFAVERVVPRFREALRAYGLPAGEAKPEVVAARLRQRPARVRAALVAALDEWIDLASDRRFGVREPHLSWLRAVVVAVEPQDDWTRRFRSAQQQTGRAKRREALERLAAEPGVGKLPAASLERLAGSLQALGSEASALKLRRLAQQQYSGDFRANQKLGIALRTLSPPESAEAVGYLTAAVALRPESPGARLNLANALGDLGKGKEAIACYQKAIDLDPQYAAAHNNLGVAFDAAGRPNQAIACYRRAIELDPKDASVHYNLGNTLKGKGKVNEAIACFRQAIALDPRFAQAHTNLGLELAGKGQLDEAIACYRKALKIDARLIQAHVNLGLALSAKGQVDEAIASYQKAIDLAPKDAMPHGALGQALLRQGRYAEARDASARALALLPEGHPLRARASEQIQACEQMLKLEARLPGLLQGEDVVRSAEEGLALAQMCQRKRLHAAAVRFSAGAFAADPRLAFNVQAQYRYSAACSAALAAAGQGEDAAKLDDAAKARLRSQALDWLKADLAVYTRLLDAGRPEARPFLVRTLSQWKQNRDLAGIRDQAALTRLPEQEQKAFTLLWTNVAALLKKAEPLAKKEGT
jgi:serine/threonine-protein kinase